MAQCWARTLGGCSDEGSKEHLVTASLWENDDIYVVGFPWCKDAPKKVGISSLVSKILCKSHNNALSPLDAAAQQAFSTFRNSTQLTNKRVNQPQRKWKIRRFEVPQPWLLERWFLKSAINLIVVNGAGRKWRQSGRPAEEAPEALVRIAFGIEPMKRPRGLYVAATAGETVAFQDSVTFAPLTYDGPNLVAGLFSFSGLRFVLHFEEHELPDVLTLPTSAFEPWKKSGLLYHMQKMNANVGRHLSHYIHFLWHLPA